jgi:hypothetical protein
MNEQQLIKLLENAEGTIARLMLEVNRLSKELEQRNVSDEEIIEVWKEYYGDVNIMTFARAILRKASEK